MYTDRITPASQHPSTPDTSSMGPGSTHGQDQDMVDRNVNGGGWMVWDLMGFNGV